MKLKGTKTEEDFRAELVRSKDSIFNKDPESHLETALRNIFPALEAAYVLHWIPDQYEDIYMVLVNGESLISIEIDREGDAEPIIEHMSLENYSNSISKINQIRLLVALDLSSEDINEHNNSSSRPTSAAHFLCCVAQKQVPLRRSA